MDGFTLFWIFIGLSVISGIVKAFTPPPKTPAERTAEALEVLAASALRNEVRHVVIDGQAVPIERVLNNNWR